MVKTYIVPPFATPLGYTSALHPQDEGESYWFIFSGDQLLVGHDMRVLPQQASIPLKRTLYLGILDNRHLYAGEAEKGSEIPPGWLWASLRMLYGNLSDSDYAMAGRAMQLIDWDRTHTYCGCCGTMTFIRTMERCRECPACGHLAYPKLAPAIMALVKKEDLILLARSPHFPEHCYSVLAGFVDPGETLEQCVAREVFEEVGLRVKNITYFGSQPWPFSRSLMIAFTCDWIEGEITIDPVEIAHAAWFDRTNLPQLPPPLSISRILIDAQLRADNQI